MMALCGVGFSALLGRLFFSSPDTKNPPPLIDFVAVAHLFEEGYGINYFIFRTHSFLGIPAGSTLLDTSWSLLRGNGGGGDGSFFSFLSLYVVVWFAMVWSSVWFGSSVG